MTILQQLAEHAAYRCAEAKKVISEEFPYLQIAKEYEAAGADCISVLTEPKWFLGSDRYLREIAAEVSIPIIRKDFTVEPYMIYEAKVMGASAMLIGETLMRAADKRRTLEELRNA